MARSKKKSKEIEDAVEVAEDAVSDAVETSKDAVDDAVDAVQDAAEDAISKDGPEDAPVDAPDVDAPSSDDLDADLEHEAEAETEVDPAPEPEAPAEPEPAPAVVNQTVVRKGGFLPLLLGGGVAAALGYFVADPERLPSPVQSLLPASMLSAEGDMQAMLDAQAGQIAALEARLGEMASIEPFDPAALEGQIGTVTDTVASMGDQMSGLETKLTGTLETALGEVTSTLDAANARILDLEKRPLAAVASEEAIAAYERELDGLKSELTARSEELRNTAAAAAQEIETAKADAAERASEAERLEQLAAAKAAMGKINSSVETGADFSQALSDLKSVSPVEVPAVFDAAAAGVASLASLQADFPDAARAALASARADGGMPEGTGRLAAFFAKQTGARSVAPRDGDDADAVLSRAEAAVKSGDLSAALTEIQALDGGAAEALASWTTAAQLRLDAATAAQALNSQLNNM
ncbi:MAG: hypothetical protein AAGD04_02160 [Pseudomonadota bacterium]